MEPIENVLEQRIAAMFTTVREVSCELARCRLGLAEPAPTELYVSDPHGEYETFSHIVRSGCGRIDGLVDETFHDELPAAERDALSTLVCYPEEKMAHDLAREDERTWMRTTIGRLLRLFRHASGNHLNNEAYFHLDGDISGLVEDLLLADAPALAVDALVDAGGARGFVTGLCTGIRGLVSGKLHLVGDVYDRGPAPDLIMEELEALKDVDIQWGNHDIVWMGAALGQRGCIAHVVRNCARYANLSILTDSYGIDMQPLVDFALEAYADDPCTGYALKSADGLSDAERMLNEKVQKAMAILQFKVEGQLIDANPSFGFSDRKLLHRIDPQTWTVEIDGTRYPLTDTRFPTVDWQDPYALTAGEERAMRALEEAFRSCEKLQRHVRLLLDKGSLYHIENGTLLFHACVPLEEDGTLKDVELFGETYRGRALFDAVDRQVRAAFSAEDEATRKQGADLLWYLWLGPGSPLFAKSKMATFEIYLVADKTARTEVKNPFYALLDDGRVLDGIFEDFGMDPQSSRIVCGHTPVKVKDGADPVKCGGRLVIIDGGMSRAYQKTTGIAGFTLVSDSHGVRLASHEPFAGRQAAIETDAKLRSSWRDVERFDPPRTCAQTDAGVFGQSYIAALERLLLSLNDAEDTRSSS